VLVTFYARFIGIDPGPTPGIVALDARGDLVAVVQCTHEVMLPIVRDVLDVRGGLALIAVERFVARGRASADQALTRDQVGSVMALFPGRVVQRSASEVKPWATDRRLQAAVLPGDTSLFLRTAGMRHARDAARHALFAAVKDGGLPDPLSKEFGR
jgi:hypothetical protein